MSMKVNFNLSAILANDYLRKTDDALTLSTQRLSSGYKINRAGDNPSGMAIGRRMRAQIKSISQSGQNASDAVSVVQTAEGAMNEIHDMLQRLNELTIKAANGTLSGDDSVDDEAKAEGGRPSTTGGFLTGSDRSLIQAEVDQLIDEIERIAKTTEFNGRKLLDGTFDVKGYVEKTDYAGKLIGNDPITTDQAKAAENALQAAVTVESYSDEVTAGFYNISMTLGKNVEYTYKEVYDYTDPDHPEGVYKETIMEKVDKGFTISALSVINTDNGVLAPYDFHGEEVSLINVMGQYDTFTSVDQRTSTLKGDNNFSLTMDVDWSKLTEVVPNANYDPDVIGSPKTETKIKADFGDFIKAELDLNSPMFSATLMDAVRKERDAAGTGKIINDADGNDVGNGYLDQLIAAYEALPGNLGFNNVETKDAIEAVKRSMIDADSIDYVINLTGMGSMTEQIGPEEGTTLEIRIPKISAKNLGIYELNVMDQENARISIDRVSAAIDRLSENRGRLGAYQNRLEHTMASLDNTEESMTTAFSRIMDTDMAKEMTVYSQQQVMSQAGTSMLAQANQRPSQILQLLQ